MRRTSSLRANWPEGRHGPVQLDGIARDLFTPDDGSPARTVKEDCLSVTLDADRGIRAIGSGREVAALQALLGRPSIGGLRGAIADALADEAAAGSPLYALVEDIPGVSLVCNFAWARWPDTRAAEIRVESTSRQRMQGVCAGFAAGSSALSEPVASASSGKRVPSLIHPQDLTGWHALPTGDGVDMCRVRRIDTWLDGGLLCVDAMFQDSAAAPNDTREAAHEYALQATIDPQRGVLLDICAQAHILPFRECPGVIPNLQRLVGAPLAGLRRTVLGSMSRTDGCTHLNDAVRALAEILQYASPLLGTPARPF